MYYFYGGQSKKMMTLLRKQFGKDGCFVFGNMKMSDGEGIDTSALAWELRDLIFPYLYGIEVPYGEGPYEKFDVAMNPGDIVIDAGANIGLFTNFAAVERSAVVYAFEPVRKVCNVLEKNVSLNNAMESVHIIPAALSDRVGKLNITTDEGTGSANRICADSMEDVNNVEEVDCTTIDEFVKNNQLNKLDFIKADIEGAERFLLYGAKETLKKLKPRLAICTYHLPDDKEVLTDIILSANPKYKIYYSSHKLYAK